MASISATVQLLFMISRRMNIVGTTCTSICRRRKSNSAAFLFLMILCALAKKYARCDDDYRLNILAIHYTDHLWAF